MPAYTVDDLFATVGAAEDIDGDAPTIIVTSDRRNADPAVFEMTPKTARALARRLNRWARAVSA